MSINILIVINASTLITIITLGIRLMRFVDRIEFRTDLMWEDYKRRVEKGLVATVVSLDGKP